MALLDFRIEGHIGHLTINRPDALNALGLDGDGTAFAEACASINANPDIRCAIITGAGRAFSAGGDIKAMANKSGAFSGSASEIRQAYRHNIHGIVRALWGLEVPLIAAVNGPAIGLGCDAACLADIRLAGASARFGVTFLKLGLIPGDGGAWLQPRIIGASRAAELLFTGKVIGAETAQEWGLVSAVHPDEGLADAALKLALEIAQQPPQALRATKTLLRQGTEASFDTIMEMSAATQGLMHHSDDHIEGVKAVLEKRAPNFTGK